MLDLVGALMQRGSCIRVTQKRDVYVGLSTEARRQMSRALLEVETDCTDFTCASCIPTIIPTYFSYTLHVMPTPD